MTPERYLALGTMLAVTVIVMWLLDNNLTLALTLLLGGALALYHWLPT